MPDAILSSSTSNNDNDNGGELQYPFIPEEMDEVLSKELQQLSFDDRNAIQEEIHGVRNTLPNETPELIHEGLDKLTQELHAISNKLPNTAAYNQAIMQPLSYVYEQAFRIRFLRSELWDAKKAARRIVSFLDMMAEFYGPKLLMRPIQLSDLSEQEIKVLKSGQIQLLPFRDRSGRRIIAFVADMGFELEITSKVSCSWARERIRKRFPAN